MALPAAPTGTVTFLFTDIEGSTRFWDDAPDSMRDALAKHDQLLRASIESHGGHVFKTVGDAFCAAFSEPSHAVEAAIASQIEIGGITVGTSSGEFPLRVRMAIHTGSAEARDSDYFGPTLNRVARVLSLGHGGQVLVSRATCELLRGTLPANVALRLLGEHRLKDLSESESIFQLHHPDLGNSFPPLRTVDHATVRHNLPEEVTSFVGREEELAQVGSLLKQSRLLTLTGSGGCGKTRLALHAGADMVPEFEDGVWLVELASIRDPDLVARSITDALGVKEQPGRSLAQVLIDHLTGRQALIVLDNCEHLLNACATLADSIIRGCPAARILATSREALGITGETTFRVPSLSLPDPKHAESAEDVAKCESVCLFMDRAQKSNPGYHLTKENASDIASICLRLDGIPLAIELAAARIRSLSASQVNQRLEQRFRLLTGGSRTGIPRHQTLQSLIDWSYELLTEREKAMLGRLCVFSGGWTLEACEQVCSGDPIDPSDALDLMLSLLDKSLVIADLRESSTRYRMLESIRQYARDRLNQSGQDARWWDRHASYFLDLAERICSNKSGTGQLASLDQLESEHDNLRTAMDWFGSDPARNDETLRLCAAISHFWHVRGYFAEGRERLSQALWSSKSRGSPSRAKALHCAASLAYQQGDIISMRALLLECLEVNRALGDKSGIGSALQSLAEADLEQGHYEESRSLFDESMALFRELDDRVRIADAANGLGILALIRGEEVMARELIQESLEMWRAEGRGRGVAMALNCLGIVARSVGDFDSAHAYFAESLAMRRGMDDRRSISVTLNCIGMLMLDQGNLYEACGYLNEGLAISIDLGDRQGIAEFLRELATLAYLDGSPLSASNIWGSAERIRQDLGLQLPLNDRERYETHVCAARAAAHTDAEFDAAWATGRAQPIETAIVAAQAIGTS